MRCSTCTGMSLLARIDDSMSEINFNTIERTDLILHLIDTLLLSHKAFIGYHKDLSIMYHSDEAIKQLMDAQYETGRLKTLTYLQMGQDEPEDRGYGGSFDHCV